MMTLSNVTVIIPAHNRPERLYRLLRYYGSTDIRIIVPDSSDLPFERADEFPEAVYLHRPRLHFLKKIREVLPLVRTPYVLYCADDDFAVPEGIARVASFLEAHPDYSTAQGYYLTFTPRRNKVEFIPRYIRYFDKQVTADTPRERLSEEKNMYASLLYGVIRTEAFRRMYEACFREDGSLRFANLFLAEEFFNHAALIFGKYATLPCFFSARERIEGSATDTTVPVSVVKQRPEYRAEFEGFIEALGILLAESEQISQKEARDFIRRISTVRKEPLSIACRRKAIDFVRRCPGLRLLNKWAEHRYKQKGRKVVKGLPGFPTEADPAVQRIREFVGMQK